MKKWMAYGILILMVLAFNNKTLAKTTVYKIIFKGVSEPLNYTVYPPFTAAGRLTVDETTGQGTFKMKTEYGDIWTGDAYVGVDQKVFGVATFSLSTAAASEGEEQIKGWAVFRGVIKTGGKRFVGPFYAGTPNRLGPSPGGFVYTSGTIILRKKS